MHDPDKTKKRDADRAPPESDQAKSTPVESDQPKEIGGRGGLDPTRYGDWEKAGRCIDF